MHLKGSICWSLPSLVDRNCKLATEKMANNKNCGKIREGKSRSLQDTRSAHDTSRNPRLLSNKGKRTQFKRTQFLQLYFNYMSNLDKTVLAYLYPN